MGKGDDLLWDERIRTSIYLDKSQRCDSANVGQWMPRQIERTDKANRGNRNLEANESERLGSNYYQTRISCRGRDKRYSGLPRPSKLTDSKIICVALEVLCHVG